MLIATPVNDDLDQKHSLIFELKRPQPSQESLSPRSSLVGKQRQAKPNPLTQR